PCFRKENGSHGLEERGVYRIHQFDKQEMIVACKPEAPTDWYEKLWRYSVDLFRSFDIPVRPLECCYGDLADLNATRSDIEACSLKILYRGEDGKIYLAHTLNNTCVAPPRMLIALLENNLQADGTVKVPKVLQPYMGGKELLVPTKK